MNKHYLIFPLIVIGIIGLLYVFPVNPFHSPNDLQITGVTLKDGVRFQIRNVHPDEWFNVTRVYYDQNYVKGPNVILESQESYSLVLPVYVRLGEKHTIIVHYLDPYGSFGRYFYTFSS